MKKQLVALGAIAALLCASTAFAQEYSQAPMLDEQVDAGTLPALEERLPATPFVLTPIESVGNYGGTWKSALRGQDAGWLRRTIYYEPLLSYSYDWSEVVPNVAESFEANEDATEFTFKLREGHKWSDGAPLTAHDIVFAIEDILANPDYMGVKGPYSYEGITAEAVDDLTLKLTLNEPNSLLLQQIASVEAKRLTQYPKHYCSQFMPKYNPDAEALAAEQGHDNWSVALEQNCDENIARNLELPTLNPWVITAPMDGTNQLVTFERNPYYFKVDTEGNQLPYFDNVEMAVVSSTEDLVLRALNGEYDFGNRHLATLANKPVFFENQERGGYSLYDTIDARMNVATVQLNLTSEDPVKRELYNEVDFRKALSHGLNREEIIDVVFAGQGEPFQAAPRPESRWFNEELAKQYTEYDPDLANELLDGLGLTERNGEGVRLMSDGRPLRIELNSINDIPEFGDIAQLMDEYWREIGVDLDVRGVDRTFAYETFNANAHDMHVWWGDGGMGDALLDPRYYFPFNLESGYALKWAHWFMNPDNPAAETPSEPAMQQIELYGELLAAADPAKQDELFNQILDIAQEQFWLMGISLPAKGYGIARNDIGNVPQDQIYTWIYPNPGPMFVAQLYRK